MAEPINVSDTSVKPFKKEGFGPKKSYLSPEALSSIIDPKVYKILSWLWMMLNALHLF